MRRASVCQRREDASCGRRRRSTDHGWVCGPVAIARDTYTMTRLLSSSVLALAVAACGGTDPDVNPPWLLELIAQQEAEPVANPPAYIARQEYASGIYYFLPSRCCDIYSDLYDADGTLVCHPD